jgi:hypothetical protein
VANASTQKAFCCEFLQHLICSLDLSPALQCLITETKIMCYSSPSWSEWNAA